MINNDKLEKQSNILEKATIERLLKKMPGGILLNKKPYIAPKMNVIDMKFDTQLLASSSADPDECENPYWCGEHEGWKGGWGE